MGGIRRHRRTCPEQVQLKSEVANLLHKSGADHPQKTKTKQKRDDSRDRLRDLPEWLEEFADNLEDTVHAIPHTFLRTRILSVLRMWSQSQRSIVLKLNSQKTEIAKSACEPK